MDGRLVVDHEQLPRAPIAFAVGRPGPVVGLVCGIGLSASGASNPCNPLIPSGKVTEPCVVSVIGPLVAVLGGGASTQIGPFSSFN